jgi:hypothetical protein
MRPKKYQGTTKWLDINLIILIKVCKKFINMGIVPNNLLFSELMSF